MLRLMRRIGCRPPVARFLPSTRGAALATVALLLAAPVLAEQEAVPEGPAGAEHTCAIGFGGSARCWGTNFSGQLGDGTHVNRNVPVAVVGLARGVVAIATGSEHTCAVVKRGVKCWGANFSGQLGNGSNVNSNVPVDVTPLSFAAIAVAAGASHSCALSSDGAVKCWGENFSGQLGDGSNDDRGGPVDVSGLSRGVTAIAAGSEHTCAIVAGTVWCWGANFSGQLGDGTNVSHNRPVAVIGLPRGATVTAISTGSEHTCAVVGGRVTCWGANFSGQLGDGANVNRNSAVEISGLPRPVVAIATGGSHSCALAASGGVKCWGENFSGQLGDGSNDSRSKPVDASGLSRGISAIAAGSEHTCAITAIGAMRCWGANFSGQLGDGTNVNRNAPVDVPGLPVRRPWVGWRWL